MILVVDVGTTGLRAALVDDTAAIRSLHYRPFPPSTPSPGLVEFDATEMGRLVLDAARAAIADAGSDPVTAVGITNQRASTIIWDRATGEPIAPALGWQDLRTVGECIMAKIEHGLPLAPNQSATKIAWLLANVPGAADRDLCFGTVDSWVAWVLSEGAVHVTDHSNAAVTGLFQHDGSGWNHRVCELLGIPVSILPSLVDSSGLIGSASALPGRAADRGDGGRPAGVIGRAGLCAARPREDHVRHRRDARRVHGQRRAGHGEPHRQRHLPDRRVVTRR